MAAYTRRMATAAADEVIRALDARGACLTDAYGSWLPVASAAILERLLSALAREGIGQPHIEAVEGERIAYTFGSSQGQMRAEFKAATATGRLALAGPVVFDRDGRPDTTDHPVHALDALAQGGALDPYPASAIDVVRRELDDSVRNYAMALVGAEARSRELAARAAAAGIRTAMEWARAQRVIDPSFSVLAFFEQWVIDGHPLHPGAKIKLGLTPEEVMAYSPEWGVQLNLRVAAIHRDHAAGAGDVSLSELLRAEHHGLGAAADRTVRAIGGNPAHYELVPVHPWQAARVLPHKYGPHLASGAVVLVPNSGIPATPLMNFRTFAPALGGAVRYPSHLKTAVDVQLTGAVRGVSPPVVENGPRVSRLLADVLRRERGFAGRLVVLAERAGTYFAPGAGDDPALTRSLGALARTNPEEGLAAGELALPVAALYSRSPLTQGPIVAELLDELAAAERLASRAAAARRFTAGYAEVSVEPLLTLLTRYGIALEAHPQNTVVVVREGLPVRLAIRDLGAVRISAERLAHHGLRVRLLPSSAIAARSDDEMRGKLFFSFFQNHLGELLSCLARLSSCREAVLWAPFATAARRAFVALREDGGDAALQDERGLFNQPLPLKRVLAMRLDGSVTEESFVDAPNPLRTAGA
ncbi:MAG: IucA/IucC family protein [Egibacteraceae bacterium]